MLVKVLAFTSVYFFESRHINGLRAIQIGKSSSLSHCVSNITTPGKLSPTIRRTIAQVSAFRQLLAQGGLGRPSLAITHSRASGGSCRDATFRLASAGARGYRARLGIGNGDAIASCVKLHKGGSGERERPEISKSAPRTQDRRRAEKPSGIRTRCERHCVEATRKRVSRTGSGQSARTCARHHRGQTGA